MFKNFAQLIAFHLDAQERAAEQEAALVDARDAARLREQFVAILAPDLRNPRQSMQASTCFCIADRTRKRSAKAQLADHLLQMLLERLIWMAVQREPSAQSRKKAAPIGRPFRKWT
jgi:hypothetical protein